MRPLWRQRWEAVTGPTAADGSPIQLIDVAVAYLYKDDDDYAVYVLDRDGHLYERREWRGLDIWELVEVNHEV